MSGKIISLKAKNILRLKAVEIDPKGNLVIIGGDNAQGKTSVLDSIMMALAGKKSIKPEPIHRGEAKGKITLDIGDYIVTQSFTAKGSSLKVETAKGVPQKSPQALLDGLVGTLSFDPLAFGNEKPAKQAEILKELVGLDFGDLEEKRAEAYAERTAINRNLKAAKARIDGMPHHDDAPDKEVLIAGLIEELDEAKASNEEIKKRAGFQDEIRKLLVDEALQIEALRQDIRARQRSIEEATEADKECTEWLACAEVIDVEEIQERLSGIEETNRKFRDNQSHRNEMIDLNDLEEAAEEMTADIQKIDEEKAAKLAAAKFPVAGLGLGEEGVTFQDLPLEQCSGAERLKITVGMAIAMNPKLKVLLLRDGSLLDDRNMEVLAQMADEAGAQVWIERVGDKDKNAVIIEDGQIRKEEK